MNQDHCKYLENICEKTVQIRKLEHYKSNYCFDKNRYTTYNPCFLFCQDILCKASDGITEFHMGTDPWIFKLWSKRINGLKTGYYAVWQLVYIKNSYALDILLYYFKTYLQFCIQLNYEEGLTAIMEYLNLCCSKQNKKKKIVFVFSCTD